MTSEATKQPTRRASDPLIEIIVDKVSKVEASVDKLTEAITKLAVIEERQFTDRQALERAFEAIQRSDERCVAMFEKCVFKLEKIESRTDSLEKDAPMNKQIQSWVIKALWACAAFAALIVTNKLNLL